jgi:hypothetical protein
MMQASTDYNATVSQLGMGDRFQLSHHGTVHTVAWTDGSVDGGTNYVRTSTGDVMDLAMYRRCHVVEQAPRCDCGRRFDYCDQGCLWPDALEALFMV